jgi:tRNA(fMet)-specific endonuclease VapC
MLDTNICIYIIKKKPLQMLNRFRAFNVADIGVSSITLSELEYGVEKSTKREQNREALMAFLGPLEIAPYDDLAAHHCGGIRALLEKAGRLVGAMDLLIAAHARSLSVPLVTNNMSGFKRIPGLSVENWLRP